MDEIQRAMIFGEQHTARSVPVLMHLVEGADGRWSLQPVDPSTPEWVDSTTLTDTERVFVNWRTGEERREPFDQPPKEPARGDPPGG